MPGRLKRTIRPSGLAALALLAVLSALPYPSADVSAGPTSWFGPEPAAAQTGIRVAAYNIKHGRGMDDEVDLTRIATVLRALDADVITLQEVDDRTERTRGVDQVAVLAGLMGYEGIHGPHRPYQGGFYGNAVLTRLPVIASETVPIPGASGSALAVLEVTVRPTAPTAPTAATAVTVVSVHLAGSPDERMAQAEALTERYTDADHPVVLAGDFNGRPDDVVIRGLSGAWTIAEKTGSPFTYPADVPDREIDYVVWMDGRGVSLREHFVIEEPLASDHRPILAVLHLSVPAPIRTPGASSPSR